MRTLEQDHNLLTSCFLSKRQARSQCISACMLYHIVLPSQHCDLSYFACTGLIDLICKAETNHNSHFQDPCVSPQSGQVTAVFDPAPFQSSSVHKINLFLGSLIPRLCLPHLLLSHLNTSQSYKKLAEAWNSPVQCLSVLSFHSNKIRFFSKSTFLSMTEPSISPASANWKSHGRHSATTALPF